MEGTLISWNVPNLITIWLMLFLGLFVLAFLAQWFVNRKATQAAGANNAGGY